MVGKPAEAGHTASPPSCQERPGGSQGLFQSYSAAGAGSPISGHRFPTRSLPSAAPMPPTQAPYSSEQGLLGGGGGSGWLSQLKRRLKALFLLAPSWQYFCRSVSSEEPAIYFAGSSPGLGSLSGTPDPCPALANVL